MNTPKSSSTPEIQELRYRISQLEHLVVTNSLNPTVSPGNSPTLTQNSLIERISHLEGLLAASELENKNLCNEIQLLAASKNRDEVEFMERINACNSEISDLQYSVQLLELKCFKGNSKIENMKNYINSLPSKEELDEAKESVVQLESENHALNSEIDSLRNEISRLEVKMLERDKDYQNAVVRLKELEPLEEAQQEYLDKNGNFGDLANEKSISELCTIQRAQIIRCTKIISSLRNKVMTAESRRAAVEVGIAKKTTETDFLNQQLLASKLKTDKLLQKVDLQEQDRQRLHIECGKLSADLERKDNYLRSRGEEMENLIKLSAEVDICMNDLSKLIELGECIAHGEEPSVDSLIGIPDQLQSNLACEDEDTQEEAVGSYTISGFAKASLFGSTNIKDGSASFNKASGAGGVGEDDPEWILERLKSVRDMRKSIEKLRNQLIDLYTDILEGSTDACNIQ